MPPEFDKFSIGLSSKAANRLSALAPLSDLELVTGDDKVYLRLA